MRRLRRYAARAVPRPGGSPLTAQRRAPPTSWRRDRPGAWFRQGWSVVLRRPHLAERVHAHDDAFRLPVLPWHEDQHLETPRAASLQVLPRSHRAPSCSRDRQLEARKSRPVGSRHMYADLRARLCPAAPRAALEPRGEHLLRGCAPSSVSEARRQSTRSAMHEVALIPRRLPLRPARCRLAGPFQQLGRAISLTQTRASHDPAIHYWQAERLLTRQAHVLRTALSVLESGRLAPSRMACR